MEALSGVASGMAVVSLTVQLLQSANTIKAFIRDVKGASKELERLLELLDCLSALLTDVRNVMERQISLQHCPLPSPTIFDCLKSCEHSLTLLEDIAKKHERKNGGGASAMRKLKDDIKFGFKTQDIANVEARVQRNMNSLNAALGTNATNIQLTTLSVLLRYEQSSLASVSAPQVNQPWNAALSSDRVNSILPRGTSLVRPRYGTSTRFRQQQILSSLRSFGIHVQKSIQEANIGRDEANSSGNTPYDVTFTSYEAMWKLLGYGIHWSRTYTYGNISPALRVFPLVDTLRDFDDLIYQGTIQEVQQAFKSGVLHPFTKDQSGFTLLHMAAEASRLDICHLLRKLGVKAEMTSDKMSPFLVLLNSARSTSRDDLQIDTIRTFLLDFDTIDEFNTIPSFAFNGTRSIVVAKWLWTHAALAFHGTELVNLRAKLLYGLLFDYAFPDPPQPDKENIQAFMSFLHDEVVVEHLEGTYQMLPAFLDGDMSMDSKLQGDSFINLLTSLHLDVEACVIKELERFPGDLMVVLYDPFHSEDCPEIGQTIIFERDLGQRPILRWEWAYDPHAPGYDVVSEFTALATDARVNLYLPWWPFRSYNYIEYTPEHIKRLEFNISQRFDRRTAAKARRERARTGQKRSRSKMPGTWNW